MNDQFYKDEPVFKLRPTHIKKQRKPPFVREFGLYSPYLLNKKPVPSDGKAIICIIIWRAIILLIRRKKAINT